MKISSACSEKDNRGFALVEVIAALAVIAVTITAIMLIVNKALMVKKTANTVMTIKQIETAVETTYREDIAYVETNCAGGWGQSPCDKGSITPVPGSTNTVIQAWLPTQTAVQSWVSAGCALTTGSIANYYNIQCTSGFGSLYSFTNIVNAQAQGGLYLNGYNKTPYSITISAAVPNSTTPISDVWNSGYLDAEYFERSNQKILSLLRAIKNYHFARVFYEANNNPCTPSVGGLASSDDSVIPWVWQLTASSSTNAQLACAGVESGNCGCSNFTAAVWSSSASYLQVDTAAEMNTILGNLGLDSKYGSDGYGNMITLRLLADRNGNQLANAPSRPKPNYTDCLPSGSGTGCSNGVFQNMPPYTGVAGVLSGGSWVYSQKVVYGN